MLKKAEAERRSGKKSSSAPEGKRLIKKRDMPFSPSPWERIYVYVYLGSIKSHSYHSRCTKDTVSDHTSA